MNGWQNKRRTDDAAKYLFGKVESIIEIYARSANLIARELADRVGELLLAETVRESLGVEDRVSALPGEASIRSAALAEVALARNSHRGAQVKPHWTQQPKNRAKLMKHVREMWRARKAAPKHGRQSLKGYSYGGTHWTQQPQNKARLKAQMKRLREEFLAKVRKGKR